MCFFFCSVRASGSTWLRRSALQAEPDSVIMFRGVLVPCYCFQTWHRQLVLLPLRRLCLVCIISSEAMSPGVDDIWRITGVAHKKSPGLKDLNKNCYSWDSLHWSYWRALFYAMVWLSELKSFSSQKKNAEPGKMIGILEKVKFCSLEWSQRILIQH